MIILFEVKNHPYTTIFSLVGVGADDIYENHTMRQKVNFANFWRNLSFHCHSNMAEKWPSNFSTAASGILELSEKFHF